MIRVAGRLIRLFVLGSVLLWGAPVLAKVFNPATFRLPNGLEIVVVEDHLAPVVTQMVWYKCGSADEVPGKSGIAHFLEHLMFKGTPTVPAGELSKIVARNGGEDNAFTNYDYTAYYQTIRADRLELMMKLESDRMANLGLKDDQVYPERDVIVEERRQRIEVSPEARLAEALKYALFVNSPYGRPVIGWRSEMEQLTTADAVDWYKTWYAPNNAILVVVGDVKPDDVKALAERYYGPIPARPVPARKRPQLVALPGTERRVTLRDEEVRQPALIRLYAAPNYSAANRTQALALEIFDEIFGSGTTSRLYQALVVKGKVATGAGTSYDDAAIDPVAFGIYATPAPGKDIQDVEKAIDAEVARVVKDGVTGQEVADAQTRLEAQAILARDSLEGPALSLGEALTTGQTISDVEDWPDNLAKVTPADVNQAARTLFGGPTATGWVLPSEGTKAPTNVSASAAPALPAGPIR